MLKVSDNFKKSCNSDKLKYREFIIIDNKEIDIKGNLSATAYKDTTFFGKFNLKMLTFETENDIDYKGKEFVYYKEVDGESAKIGTFIVTEVKDSDTFENVNVTAYDYGLNFANPYKSALDYKSNKITMLQIAQEICTNCGVELENTSLPNGNFIVDSNQFINGEQFGDVVCLIALENGMFATINENNKLEFIFKKETVGIVSRLSTEDNKNLLTEDDNYIVVNDLDTINDYVNLDDKRDTKPITCVLVATNKDLEEAGAIRKDQDLIKKYGENWLKIYDYAFAYSSEKCEQLIDAIFNQVKGFGYSSFETNYSFKPYLQLGDEIKFRNKRGNLVKSIILRIESNYDEIKLSAPSIINASVEYDLPETEEELVKGAIISVNKANAEIVMKVTSDGKLAQVRLDGNASDGSIFEIKSDNIKLEGYTTINGGFQIDLEGNVICNNATIKGSEVVLSDNTKIIGGNGLLTNLQFQSTNVKWLNKLPGSYFLGYNYAYSTGAFKNWLEIDCIVPEGFTITEAYVNVYHTPVNWDGTRGYCRNLKLYKVLNPLNVSINGAYLSEYEATYNYIENNTNALNFTANGTSSGEIATSSDIKNLLDVGFNKFTIHTSDSVPSVSADDNLNQKLGAYTGYCYAVVNIIGFKK